MDLLMRFVADIAPNQQGNEGGNIGVVEHGRHAVKAFVHCLDRTTGQVVVRLA
jgi:hypothetical protein